MHVGPCVVDGVGDHGFDTGVVDIDGGALDGEDGVGIGFGVAGEDGEDAVGVDGELDPDAGAAARAWVEVDLELAEFPVVACHFAFALEDANEHGGLEGDGVGEHFAGLGGNGGVAREDDVHEPAEGFEAEGERGDVEECQALQCAGKHAALDDCAEGDGFVRVLGSIGVALEDFCGETADHGDAGAAADEDDRGEVLGGETCVVEGHAAVGAGAIEDGSGEGFEFGAGDGAGEVLLAVEERDLDFGGVG